MFNKSGMNRVAESLHKAEKAQGLDSVLCNPHEAENETLWELAKDADVHVTHTHFPDWFRRRCTKKHKVIYIVHGTPEHIFQSSVEDGLAGSYGHGDSWMLFQYWMQNANHIVTFWERHQKIIKSFCDKNTPVHHIPLGVDKTFWCPGPSKGKFSGNPSLFTSENCHYIKWPLDLFLLWPWVYPHIKTPPCLHAAYLPTDQHRWFFPLVNRNGASYGSHISRGCFEHADLLNALRSVDYYIGLVRYGDHNRMCLEANAAGTKTISYAGNPYSDFWLPEGDQRITAERLTKILNGQVKPRKKTVVPEAIETAQAMKDIYESL